MPNQPQPKFFVVLFPESGEPELKAFGNIEAVAATLRRLPDTTRGYAFAGEQLMITEAPWRYLMWSGSPPVPLFEPPKIGRLDRSSSLGYRESRSPVDPVYQRLEEEFLIEDSSDELVEEPDEVEAAEADVDAGDVDEVGGEEMAADQEEATDQPAEDDDIPDE